MRRLVHIGSVLVDIGVRVPRPPARGEDMLASSASMAVAGGFNILSAAYRQGMPAAYGGNIGSGRFGAMAVETLAAEGIEVLLPPKHEGDTGFCVVMVDATGERTMVTTMGVEAYMTPEDLAAIVSVSPPSPAAVRHACHGSCGCRAAIANAAGTASCVATPVPTNS